MTVINVMTYTWPLTLKQICLYIEPPTLVIQNKARAVLVKDGKGPVEHL